MDVPDRTSAKLVKAAQEFKEKKPLPKQKPKKEPTRGSLRYVPTRSVKSLTIPKEFNFSRPKKTIQVLDRTISLIT